MWRHAWCLCRRPAAGVCLRGWSWNYSVLGTKDLVPKQARFWTVGWIFGLFMSKEEEGRKRATVGEKSIGLTFFFLRILWLNSEFWFQRTKSRTKTKNSTNNKLTISSHQILFYFILWSLHLVQNMHDQTDRSLWLSKSKGKKVLFTSKVKTKETAFLFKCSQI